MDWQNQEGMIRERDTELNALKVKLDEYDLEFRELKNQEVKVRELEAQLRDLNAQLQIGTTS